MALRKVAANLAVAALLGCPYICLAEAGMPQTGVERPQRSCCNCCGPNQPDQERPGGSDSQSGPRSCLCGGALVETPVRTQAPDAEILAPVVYDQIFAAADRASANSGRAALLSSHSPPPCSGRALRALIDSYLL
ncbi:MAG: hypothetical protein ACYSWU_24470 [Planctomycetota bacterium]|jgi:hypothetical protein